MTYVLTYGESALIYEEFDITSANNAVSSTTEFLTNLQITTNHKATPMTIAQ